MFFYSLSTTNISAGNKQKSQSDKVNVCGEDNIKYIYVNPKGEVWGKARGYVLIMSELSDAASFFLLSMRGKKMPCHTRSFTSYKHFTSLAILFQ